MAVSKVSKKVANMPLGTPESLKGTPKLAGTVGLSTMGVKYAQWLPTDAFKSA